MSERPTLNPRLLNEQLRVLRKLEPTKKTTLVNSNINSLRWEIRSLKSSSSISLDKRSEQMTRTAEIARDNIQNLNILRPDISQHVITARDYDGSSPDPLRLYMREPALNKPLLTPGEEVDLARKYEAGRKAQEKLKKYRQPGESLDSDETALLEEQARLGQESRTELIERNLRLVISIAKKYMNRGVPFSDLINEGNIGLIIATDKFDWRRGARFSTYATWWIRQIVSKTVHEHNHLKVGCHFRDNAKSIRDAREQLTEELGHTPTDAQIAIRSRKEIETIKGVKRALTPPISLHTPTTEDGDRTIGDMIAGTEDTATEAEKNVSKHMVEKILAELPEREAYVLREKLGLVDGVEKSLGEIGRILGVSRQRVGQLEQEAFNKLKIQEAIKKLRESP